MKRLAAGALLALVSHASFATEAFDYARDAIQSLGSIKNASKPTSTPPSADATEALRDVLHAAVLQRATIETQRQSLYAYRSSHDTTIAQSSRLMTDAYELLVQNLTDAISSLEGVMNDPSRAANQQGTVLRQIFELDARNKDAWSMLIKVSTTIAFVLYDQENLAPDGTFVRLRITGAERAKLKQELSTQIGQGIVNKRSADSPSNMVPGQILYQFLANPKWKNADAP